MKKWRIPNLFLIGAPRSGTTTLFDILSNNDTVCGGTVKEPLYFAVRGQPEYRGPKDYQGIRSRQEYLRCYDHCGESRYVLDGSTLYYCSDNAAQELKRLLRENGQAKLLLLLRHPVYRTWSHYMQHRLQGREDSPTIRDAIEKEHYRLKQGWSPFWRYSWLSQYHQHIKRYEEWIKKGEMCVLFFEDLTQRPEMFLKQVEIFLGISYRDFGIIRQRNISGQPRYRSIAKLIYDDSHFLRKLARLALPVLLRRKARSVLMRWNTKRCGIDYEAKKYLLSLFRGVPEKLEEYGITAPAEWEDCRKVVRSG